MRTSFMIASYARSALPRAGLGRNSAVLSARSANSTGADILYEFLHIVGDHHRLQRKHVARCMGDPRTTAPAGSVTRLLDRGSGLGIMRSVGISKFFYRSLKLPLQNCFTAVNLIPQLFRIFNFSQTRV